MSILFWEDAALRAGPVPLSRNGHQSSDNSPFQAGWFHWGMVRFVLVIRCRSTVFEAESLGNFEGILVGCAMPLRQHALYNPRPARGLLQPLTEEFFTNSRQICHSLWGIFYTHSLNYSSM